KALAERGDPGNLRRARNPGGRALDEDAPVGIEGEIEHPGAAFLPEGRLPLDEPLLDGRMGAADGRMARKRQLLGRREDPQPVVGDLAFQEERRLGEIRPAGNALHRLGVEALGADHHGDRVAEERPGSEDVDLLEAERAHGGIFTAFRRGRQMTVRSKTPATLMPGDCIGPEVVAAVVRILAAAGAPFEWERQAGGMGALKRHGDPLPPRLLQSIRKTGLALKGPLTTPVGGGFRSVNVRLREEFGLYANVRPARTMLPGGRYEDIDIVLVRENVEGLYLAW